MSRGDDRTSLFYVSPTLKHLIDYNQSTIDVCIIFQDAPMLFFRCHRVPRPYIMCFVHLWHDVAYLCWKCH